MGKIRIGLSGWSYDEWQGVFYPDDLPDDHRLGYAATAFDTIEVNGTFYSLTDPESCRRWRQSAPAGFKFAVKGSRYITHMRRLREVGTGLANFFASGVLELGDMLGPLLWQLPADLPFDAQLLDSFLGMLPRDTSAAAELARKHDERVRPVSYGGEKRHRLRHVLEFRHESFMQPEMARIARRHGVALCTSQSGEWLLVEEITAGFIYLRLHGPGKLYASAYSSEEMEHWASRISAWQAGVIPSGSKRISSQSPPRRKERDVYVYFDNTASGHAPRQALELRRMVTG